MPQLQPQASFFLMYYVTWYLICYLLYICEPQLQPQASFFLMYYVTWYLICYLLYICELRSGQCRDLPI